MNRRNRIPYLLLLSQPSLDGRKLACRAVTELGGTVVAQYGRVAIEALLSVEQAEAVRQLGLFRSVLNAAMHREHLERLSDEQRRVVAVWNNRFSRGFRRLTKARTEPRSWGTPELDSPGCAPFEPEDFFEVARRIEAETGVQVRLDEEKRPKPGTGQSPEEFVTFERQLSERIGDPRRAYDLARLANQLGPRYYAHFIKLPKHILDLLWEWLNPEDSCWRMTGEMSVGLVFVESSRSGGPKFSNTERGEICSEVLTGLNWLAGEHPEGNLSWVYDIQFLTVDVADGNNDSNEDYWRNAAMAKLTYGANSYTGDWASVAAYREDMRVANRSEHAFVVFVTPFGTRWHAYAGGGRVTLARRNDWGGWGRGTIDRITAHEASHLFGAADEYTGSGTPCSSCASGHGCDNVPNGNCGSCAKPRQDCVMDGNSWRLCGYTRGQIGWSDLFVELTTADEWWAGTDDDVWIDIGDHTFELDSANHNDRESSNIEGYALWKPWLTRDDIRRVLIRKSDDGFSGGWKLDRVRVWFRGELICDSRPNRWLEDDKLWWVGCVNDRSLVNTLRVKVTTADVSWAGTDDDVTLTLGGRNWNLDNDGHDDFERGNTDTFDLDPGTGFRAADIASVRIHKSSDGFSGGWKLKGVEVIVNGSTIYNNQSINRWLEDDDRTWSASI